MQTVEAGRILRERAGGEVTCAIVLGSGLATTFRRHPGFEKIDYAELAALPKPGAAGHLGEVLVGELAGRRVAAFCGRFHLYEGHSARDVVRLVDVSVAAGAKTIVLTNAAGGLNRSYATGDLMLISDHLNLTGTNPLAVANLPGGISERFVDMSASYAPNLRRTALNVAARNGLRAHEGVYAGLLGPSFETPAEVAMLRLLGADAVGMSTVLETIEARAHGCDVLGVSLITNVHDGAPVSPSDVVAQAERRADDFARFITGVVEALPAQEPSDRTP